MSAPGVPDEAVTRVAPLGIRFWDPVTGTTAGPGLRVLARSTEGVRVAGESPSGVYVLRGLAGLGAAERGAGDEVFWQHPPVSREYRVEVGDPAERFLPLSFGVTLPVRGLFRPACAFTGSPPWRPAPPTPAGIEPSVVPLFSAASRPPPAGMAVLRAQLEFTSTGGHRRPASWAVLQVLVPDAPTALGVADGAGLVTVLFPYPEPPGLDLSPGNPATVALNGQTWLLGLRVYFGAPPAGQGAAPIAAPDQLPDLCQLLDQRPAGLRAADPDTPLTEVQLRYGQELVVRTAGHSTLLVVLDSPPA